MQRMAIRNVAGSPMALYIAAPDPMPGDGAEVPAIVLMHHRPGLDIFTLDRADRLAREGFMVAAPDLYHRQPLDRPTREGKDRLDDAEIAADIGSARDALAADPRVDSDRIGILGHCQGGRTALIGLLRHPGFRAGCIYYGGSIFRAMGGDGRAPFDLIDAIRCPVAGFFGNDDRNPSPDDVDRIDAALDKAGVAHEFHRYDGAGHAFQDFTDAKRYRVRAGEDAWARTLAFLKRELAA